MINLYKINEQQLLELETNLTAIIPKLSQQDKVIVNKFLISVQSSGEIAIDAYSRLFRLLMKYSNDKNEYTITLFSKENTKNKDLASKAVCIDEAYYAIIELCKIIIYDVDKKINKATIVHAKEPTIISKGIRRNGI